jgi:hypothetical protein
MGDISLRGRGAVRKKFSKGGLSRRGFLGVVTGLAAAPDLIKGLKSEKKAVKAVKVSKGIDWEKEDFSPARRRELIKKVNNKTATEEEKDFLEQWQMMDTTD